jgi:ribonuclease P protein component
MITRRGRKVTRGPIVVHAWRDVAGGDARAGFVVGKKVGNAVVRNRVRRRLREQVRARLDGLPAGELIIVRALPPAATATSAEFGRALDGALGALAAAPARRGSSARARDAVPERGERR